MVVGKRTVDDGQRTAVRENRLVKLIARKRTVDNGRTARESHQIAKTLIVVERAARHSQGSRGTNHSPRIPRECAIYDIERAIAVDIVRVQQLRSGAGRIAIQVKIFQRQIAMI